MSGEMVDPETGELVSMEQDKLWSAFIKAQAVMEAPKRTQTAKVRTRDGGPGYEFSYAPLDEIVSVARAALSPHGLGFNQEVIGGISAPAYVRTRIVHESGQSISSLYPVIADMTRAQGLGSGVTYARRYGLMLALGIVAEEDDDANAADGNQASFSQRGQQQQRPQQQGQPQQQRSYPAQQPTRPANGAADAARAVVNRVKAAIESATTVEQLNKAYTEDDRKSVVAQNKPNNPIGDKVWQQLMDREADKRLQLVGEAELDKYEAGDGSAEDEFMSAEEANNVFAR